MISTPEHQMKTESAEASMTEVTLQWKNEKESFDPIELGDLVKLKFEPMMKTWLYVYKFFC